MGQPQADAPVGVAIGIVAGAVNGVQHPVAAGAGLLIAHLLAPNGAAGQDARKPLAHQLLNPSVESRDDASVLLQLAHAGLPALQGEPAALLHQVRSVGELAGGERHSGILSGGLLVRPAPGLRTGPDLKA